MAGERYNPADNKDNPYAQPGPTPRPVQPAASPQTTPATQYNPVREPVASPPQQNPYVSQGASGGTQQYPALKRPRVSQESKQRIYDQGYSEGYAQGAAGAGSNGAQQGFSARPSAQRRERQPRVRKAATHWFLSAILWLIMFGVCCLLALRMLPLSYSNSAMVPELVSFVPLAIVPSVICLVLALLWHRRLLVLVCLAAVGLNAYWHAGYFTGTAKVSAAATAAVAATSDTSDNYARIMTVNTYGGMASAAEIVEICRAQNVEVLCLQEINDVMVQDLENAGMSEVLPYSLISEGASAISNGGRNAIYTKAPMSNISRNLLPIDTSSMPAADITIGNQTVRFVSVHPNSPVRGAQDLWDEGLSIIGSLSNYNHSYVVMGDFNSTWDHVRFRDLLGTTFVDAGEQSGEGFHMSYPSNMTVPASGVSVPFPSLIEIDHIVYSKNSGVVISSLESVAISGTDHKALLATLEVS